MPAAYGTSDEHTKGRPVDSNRMRGGIAQALVAVALVAPALVTPGPAQALVAPRPPVSKVGVSTGAAMHVLATSALLTASVNSKALPVSYYFVYGQTSAYGSQTPLLPVPNTGARVRVGQSVAGLVAGVIYHYRVVVVGPEGATKPGNERTFSTKGTVLSFVVAKTVHATYGSPLYLGGVLTGTGASARAIALQASPFPYLEAFTQIGRPGTTSGTGAFSFRVGNLLRSTQLRVVTLDALPIYSPTITVLLAPRVTMHVRAGAGLVRFYGTIAPAVKGARVLIQVQKAVRPGRSEITERYVTQFTTSAQKAHGDASRFSYIAKLRRSGRYRVMIQLPRGSALSSGPSVSSIVLRAR